MNSNQNCDEFLPSFRNRDENNMFSEAPQQWPSRNISVSLYIFLSCSQYWDENCTMDMSRGSSLGCSVWLHSASRRTCHLPLQSCPGVEKIRKKNGFKFLAAVPCMILYNIYIYSIYHICMDWIQDISGQLANAQKT